jgi:uncharacterized MAPEG superfamily protein
MTVELKVLGWSIVLGLVHVLLAVALATRQRGMKWNAGNREGEPPLTGVAARADRASRNFQETFVFFAAAVLAVVFAHRETEHTALGAQIYFWARVVYWPIYAAGIPYVRTLVWLVPFWGYLQVLTGLFP